MDMLPEIARIRKLDAAAQSAAARALLASLNATASIRDSVPPGQLRELEAIVAGEDDLVVNGFRWTEAGWTRASAWLGTRSI